MGSRRLGLRDEPPGCEGEADEDRACRSWAEEGPAAAFLAGEAWFEGVLPMANVCVLLVRRCEQSRYACACLTEVHVACV